ncbi:MAG: hypothetical protein Q8P18_33200 [Pseudomonadota bacterium]|nr:hypothetical protein [Pseudomonadota bacterium]
MALYVSNPRRGRRGSVKRRNPGARSEASLKQLAADLARVSSGRPPASRMERQVDQLQAKIAAMNEMAGVQRGFAGLVASQRGPAQLKVAIAAAEREAARDMNKALGRSVGKRRRKSRRKSRKIPNPSYSLATIPKSRKAKGRKTVRRAANGRFLKMGAKGRKGKKAARKGYFFTHNVYKSPFHKNGKRRRLAGHRLVKNPMGGFLAPILGLLGPVAFGAFGGELISQAGKQINARLPVPEMIRPFQNSITGILIGAGISLCSFIPAPIRHSLAVSVASVGGALDWTAYRAANGAYAGLEYGDGGNWDVEYGDDDGDELGDLAFGDLEDVAFAGDDFDPDEGEAAFEGFGAYNRRFPMRPGHRTEAGKKGDRWRFLAKAVGPKGFKQLARMHPSERVPAIARIKQEIQGGIGQPEHRQLEAHAAPVQQSYAAHVAPADPFSTYAL